MEWFSLIFSEIGGVALLAPMPTLVIDSRPKHILQPIADGWAYVG